MNTTLRAMYLDYLNNFLTVERFAAYHDISETDANSLIRMGRKYHEDYVNPPFRMEAGISLVK